MLNAKQIYETQTIHLFTVLIHQKKKKTTEVYLVVFLINSIFEMREQRASSAEQFRPVSAVNSTFSRFQTVLSTKTFSLLIFSSIFSHIFFQYSVS